LFLLVPTIPGRFLWACITFSAASLTDYFDGQIARKRNIVTSFGVFLDPLADKILVISALVAFVSLDLCGPVAVIIIISRDFMVSGIRMLAATAKGKVIAANWWGKVKTVLQMVFIVGILLACHVTRNSPLAYEVVKRWSGVAIWILALFTLISGIVYLVQNKQLINTKE
jgi:CDP-diacylglycerol--glycerol-3-phosphate 3-phosphatidyltransferase